MSGVELDHWGSESDIWVLLSVIGEEVVKHIVLLQPEDGGSTDVVLEESEDPIDVTVLREGSVVGVVLDVESDQSEQVSCEVIGQRHTISDDERGGYQGEGTREWIGRT